jgi:CheY-like chemotaxis protein
MPKRILVVDDDPVVCESLAMLLDDCGYAVAIANSGSEALPQIQSSRFDLVLTDYRMPVMDGEQLAEQIKGLSPELPVILVTGSPHTRTTPQIARVLQKPFSLQQLREAVDALT